jgi:hypothetical protein
VISVIAVEMHPWYMLIDPFLVWFYRLTGYALVDFLVGTFFLALLTVVIGEFTISLAFLASRKYIDDTTDEVVRYQNLSVDALSAGDKEAYRAANKLANDAFGRSFFMQIALSAAFLWPIFFAVDWMGHRFSDVEFRILFTDYSVGYICIFIALYAAARIIFKRIKYKLPYFKNIGSILNSYAPTSGNRPIVDQASAASRIDN